jgi:hypothetical protein
LDDGRYVEVIGAGPKNITYRILTGGAAGFTLKAAYAEIREIKKADEKRETHPFTAGERYTAERRVYEKDSFKCTYSKVVYEIIKTSDTMITLKATDTDEKPISRKPRKSLRGDWCFSIDDLRGNTFHKKAGEVKSE